VYTFPQFSPIFLSLFCKSKILKLWWIVFFLNDIQSGSHRLKYLNKDIQIITISIHWHYLTFWGKILDNSQSSNFGISTKSENVNFNQMLAFWAHKTKHFLLWNFSSNSKNLVKMPPKNELFIFLVIFCESKFRQIWWADFLKKLYSKWLPLEQISQQRPSTHRCKHSLAFDNILNNFFWQFTKS